MVRTDNDGENKMKVCAGQDMSTALLIGLSGWALGTIAGLRFFAYLCSNGNLVGVLRSWRG